jgi:hypothetical protein
MPAFLIVPAIELVTLFFLAHDDGLTRGDEAVDLQLALNSAKSRPGRGTEPPPDGGTWANLILSEIHLEPAPAGVQRRVARILVLPHRSPFAFQM